jgi:HlyD family secretion protein
MPAPDRSPKRRASWHWPIALLLVAAAAAGAGWWYYGGESKKAPAWRTAKVVRGPITASVSATGTLNAVVSVQVGSQVSGQIKEVLADYNSEVRKGQLIARIDPETFEYRVRQSQADVDATRAQVLTAQANVAAARASLSRAEVNLAEAKRDLDRKQTLVERNFISSAELDKARAVFNAGAEDVKSATAQVAVAEAQARSAQAVVAQREAQLLQARVDLERTSIRAPVDGIVIKRSIDAGQTVAASLQAPELFVIAQNLRDMQVDASIDEAEIGKTRVGQRATFTVDSFPGRSFSGEVRQVRKAAVTVQNVVTYTVVVSAQNTDLALVPGMTANVRIVTDTRESVLKVPNAALRFRPPDFQEPAPAAPKAFVARPVAAATGTATGTASGAVRALAAALLPPAHAQSSGPLAQFRERLDRDLAPTDAQKRELDAVFAAMREKFATLRDAPETDRAALLERYRVELRERVGKVLTPEQRTKYAEILAEIGSRQASGTGQPPGGGPGAGGGSDGTKPAASAAAASKAPAAVARPSEPSAPGAASGPGSALRQFRERLERELSLTESQRQQLDAIFAGMRDKFVALREVPEAERPKAIERNRAELRERVAEILTTPEQKKRYAEIVAEVGGRQSTRGRVFVLGADGKPRPVDVRVGLTDGSLTEVSAEGLKEGDDVIIGTVAPAAREAPKATSAPRLPF